MATARQSSGAHACVRGCGAVLTGRDMVCAACHAKDMLCRACGEPHGGQPLTRFCPPCRSKRRRKPKSPNNPRYTPADDELLRSIYARCNARELGPALAAAFPTRPRWSMTRRAQVLGASTVRKAERRWCPEEDAILREFPWMVPERVVIKLKADGFRRTVVSVSVRMKRLKLRATIDGFTASGLAGMMGVDSHAVIRWIHLGWLAAERRGTTGDNHDAHMIHTAAVRALLFAHPELFELSRIERLGNKGWFLSLATGGAISEDGQTEAPVPTTATVQVERWVVLHGERVTMDALAEICGRSAHEIADRIDNHGMGVEEAAFGEAAPSPPSTAASPVDVAAGAGLRALMRKHRASPADVTRWTSTPTPVLARLLAGKMPILPAPLVSAVAQLDGHVELKIVPNTWGQ